MANYIKGKVVIITGSAGGFGLITAKKIAEMGGIPIISDLKSEKVDAAVKEIEQSGGKVFGMTCDVTQLEQMNSLVRATVKKFGRVDVLINNAGTMPLAFWEDHKIAYDAWNQCIDVNLKGTMNGVISVYDQMLEQGGGQVVFMSSIYGNFPVQGSAIYQATKVGIRYLANSLRTEAAGKIKVSTINPTGVFGTDLMGGVLNPEAGSGMHGLNWPLNLERGKQRTDGTLPPEASDVNDIQYMRITPEELVDSIIHVINQPMGINISDITVRASNETYLL